MTPSIRTSLGFVMSLTLLGACAGIDDGSDDGASSSEDTASNDEALRRGVWFRHRFPPPRDAGAATGGASSGGGTAGTNGSGASGSDDDVASCAVCSKAQACCTTIQAGALCTFSEATCASLAPSAREGYLSACGVMLDTVRSVRTSLPDACR